MALGFHDFTAADVLTATQMDGLLRQSIMTFASTSARDTALSAVLAEGLWAFNTDADELYYYDGAAWVPSFTQWATYTPVWTALTVGNGVQVARLRYLHGDLRFRGKITFGTTTTVDGGTILQTIPLSKTSDAAGGSGVGALAANSTIYPLTVDIYSSDTAVNFFHSAGVLTDTNPTSTWAANDIIRWDITVPVA